MSQSAVLKQETRFCLSWNINKKRPGGYRPAIDSESVAGSFLIDDALQFFIRCARCKSNGTGEAACRRIGLAGRGFQRLV